MDSNVVISIVGFVTTIAVTVLNQRAAARASMMDRQAKAEEAKVQLLIAAQVAQFHANVAIQAQSDDIKQTIANSTGAIQVDLAKNTDISVKAFEEANNVNQKISALGLKLPPH